MVRKTVMMAVMKIPAQQHHPPCFYNFQACSHDEFQCVTSGTCVPISWHCDSVEDCSDGSDEANCPLKPVYPVCIYSIVLLCYRVVKKVSCSVYQVAIVYQATGAVMDSQTARMEVMRRTALRW
uniref:Uncharacterized protein n=1 Tax=Scylla olivacea TaxID=85551 RepID=A0A0N7ZD25_SCYOL